MCGISGVISNKNISPYLVSKMVLSQKHRGPDNSTTKRLEDNVIFGHNRLSIISLDESSNQPFTCKDKRYTITYNGEIYNYIELRNQLKSFWTFKTTSDTEVLLAAYSVWGHKCLDKLNGMFSFCIWDKKFKKLFMARDRFGVKPLHYYINNEKLVFASEIKALWAYGIKKTLNQKVCSAYLKYGSYGDLENTFWEGVSKLPAGNYAMYEGNKIKLFKWYNFRSRVINLENDTYKIDRIKELIIDAIKIRFRADVPIGINLSGGVDSSTLLSIVNLLFKDNNHIKPFTFFTDDHRYDEIKWVVSMLKNNSDNLEKCLLKYTNVPSLTKKLMKYQDEPFGGIPTIAYGKVFERAKNIGYKVLLDGQGADESWAGYDYYNSDSNLTIQGTKVSPFKINVLEEDFSSLSKNIEYPKPFNDLLLDKQYRDLFYTKIPRALRFNDRLSMMHSVELREPFLDYRLVENVFSLNKNLKIKNGIQKWLLRDISKKYLDEDILWAPKRPLQTPQREWLKEELSDWVYESLISAEKTGWFKKGCLVNEYMNYKKSPLDNSFYIWQWISIAHLINS